MPAPANLIHETSTTTGTGNLTVAAVNGKVRFSDATYGFGTGGSNVFDYFISSQAAAEWEIGTGHMSDANTLVRDTILFSSNSNNAVNFSAGTKDVTNDVPADNQITTEQVLDEDDMASDSASHVPTQQSVKAYVDSKGWTYASEVALSGTSINIATGIPTGVNEIVIFVVDPDSGSDNVQMGLQLGDSGGFETTGYRGLANGPGNSNHETDRLLFQEDATYDPNSSGANLFSKIRLDLEDSSSNTWIQDSITYVNGEDYIIGVGIKSLSAELTQIRLVSSASLTGGTARVRYR